MAGVCSVRVLWWEGTGSFPSIPPARLIKFPVVQLSSSLLNQFAQILLLCELESVHFLLSAVGLFFFFFFATIGWTPVHTVIFYSQYGWVFSVSWCGSEYWEWYQQPDVCPRRLEYSAWRSVVFIFTLTDWITGWLTGRVATGTCSWLTDSPAEQLLADFPAHRVTDWLTDLLAGRLTEQMTDQELADLLLTGWLPEQLSFWTPWCLPGGG